MDFTARLEGRRRSHEERIVGRRLEPAEGAAPAGRVVSIAARGAEPPLLVHVGAVAQRQVQGVRRRKAVLGAVPLALDRLPPVPRA